MIVESKENVIDLTFLDAAEEKILYTVLIILNRPLIIEYYLRIRDISNFIICADGAANRLYDIIDKNKPKYKLNYQMYLSNIYFLNILYCFIFIHEFKYYILHLF